MAAYYNEWDPYAAAWLRELIKRGIIAPGDVDERSIKDVQPDDIKGYTQVHCFGGIGVWSYALRRAGWADDRPVWTGSCPCQPFSVSGKRKGFDDTRHLWPELRRLIGECRPTEFIGEQVSAAADWLRLVRSDLEKLEYAVGCLPIEAASAGADHFRDRYWFVANRVMADPNSERSQIQVSEQSDTGTKRETASRNHIRAMVNDSSNGWGEGWTEHEFRRRGFTTAIANIEDRQYLQCPDGKWRRLPPPNVRWMGTRVAARIPRVRAIGNAIDPRPATQFIAAYMETQL